MPYVPRPERPLLDKLAKALADGIAEVAAGYKYDGAFLGELNFSLTRLIQHLPRSLQEKQGFKDEIRYWMYAGIVGVLVDVKDEYKRRVNHAYEAAQIEKSGDCYDTPYYTRLIDVVKEDGTKIGTMEVQLKRDESTLHIDKLPAQLVVKTNA